MPQRGLADLHMHTDHSDGWPKPAELVRFARDHTALDVIAITDHDTIEGALAGAEYASRLRSGPYVIIGEEVSSREGHIVGLFL
ncbi:MAG: PHP domain-containing protein, partial [Candidatus Dormibacteraceae bacterium]